MFSAAGLPMAGDAWETPTPCSNLIGPVMNGYCGLFLETRHNPPYLTQPWRHATAEVFCSDARRSTNRLVSSLPAALITRRRKQIHFQALPRYTKMRITRCYCNATDEALG